MVSDRVNSQRLRGLIQQKNKACGEETEQLLRRDFIRLTKPRVIDLKVNSPALNQENFEAVATRIYLPNSTQVALQQNPWRIQLFDLEEFQVDLLNTRLFTSFIKATITSHGEPHVDLIREAVELALLETLSETHLLPKARRSVIADRRIKRRSDASWVVAPKVYGVYEPDAIRATVAEARATKRILRFDYTHRDGSVLTRRVKIRRWSKIIGSYWNGDTRENFPTGFLGERHGKIREYRFERCSNMYMERLSTKKLQPEFEMLVEPDGDAATLTLKLADD